MLAKVSSNDTETVVNALIKQAHKLPREPRKSLTWDRGKELADHKRFSLILTTRREWIAKCVPGQLTVAPTTDTCTAAADSKREYYNEIGCAEGVVPCC